MSSKLRILSVEVLIELSHTTNKSLRDRFLLNGKKKCPKEGPEADGVSNIKNKLISIIRLVVVLGAGGSQPRVEESSISTKGQISIPAHLSLPPSTSRFFPSIPSNPIGDRRRTRCAITFMESCRKCF